jgi:hypothetical protein
VCALDLETSYYKEENSGLSSVFLQLCWNRNSRFSAQSPTECEWNGVAMKDKPVKLVLKQVYDSVIILGYHGF